MISAIILSHNDQDSIGKTLKSLLWCDERIIIDDYSTDRTIEIAKKYTVRVFQHNLNDDFGVQRNFGLAKAKGEWVLFVDSDEVVPEELAKEIQEVVKNSTSSFYVKRQDWLFGKTLKHGETSKVWLLRLAKKNAGIWARPVHEVWNVGGETETLVHPIDHFPHQDVAQFISAINWYSTLNARYLFEIKVKVQWWHILIYPKAKFFMDYVWYFGFLDGTA